MRSFHSDWCEGKLFPGLCEVQNCFVHSSLVFPPLTSHIFFLRHVQTNTQLKTQWDPFAELQSSFYIECPLFHYFALQFVAALNAISVFSTRQYWWSLYEFFLLVPWKLSLSSKLMKMQGSPCLFLISLESHSSMLLVVRCLKIVCSYICSCV